MRQLWAETIYYSTVHKIPEYQGHYEKHDREKEGKKVRISSDPPTEEVCVSKGTW
jgi:hypothetical protein